MATGCVRLLVFAGFLTFPAWLRADHQEAELHHRLALEYARRKQWDGAFREIERAIKVEPRNSLYLYNLGLLHYNNQEYEKALPWLRRAHELRIEEFEFHRALASALDAAGHLEEAEGEFTRLVQQHPDQARGYCGRAAVELRRARLQAARRDVDRALALESEAAEAWYLLGNLKEKNEQYDEAIKAYQRVISIEPGHVNAQYRLGVLYKRLGQDAESRRHLDTYQSLKTKLDLANAVLFGTRSLYSGDYKTAAEQLSRALASDPSNAEALYYFGVAMQKLEKPAEAVEAFEKALSINPKLALAQANLGLTLAAMGNGDKARPHLARAMELEPRDFSVNLTAARGYLALEDFGAAEMALMRSLELYPSEPQALAELFQLYALWDKSELARRYAALAAEANPNDARLQYRLGLFWAAEHDFDRAREALKRAAAMAPGNPEIRHMLDEISREQ